MEPPSSIDPDDQRAFADQARFLTDLLAACHELGVTEVYRVGGAQAEGAVMGEG